MPPDSTRLKPGWATVTLLLLVQIAVVVRFRESAWLGDTRPVLVMMTAAATYGLGLALSRFRTRTALAFNLVMALGLGAIVMGRLLPGITDMVSRPSSETLWVMHVRLFTLLEYLRDEFRRLVAGAFPSEALLAPLFGLAAWHVMSWLAWTVLRGLRAWSGLLACIGLLLANDLLAARQPTWSMWLAGCGLLLIARSAYNSKIDSWERANVDYPELVGQDWAVGAVSIAALVIFATGLSTPGWRSSLRSFLESLWPPRPVSQSVRPAAGENLPYASSFVPDLDAIGAAFPSGDATVFYVTTDDPPSGVDSSGVMMAPAQQHYWRAAIYDRYTGTGWDLAPIGEAVLQVGDSQQPAAGRYALTQHFEILALPDNRLFAVNQAVSATSGVELRASLNDRFSSTPLGASPIYTITSWPSDVTSSELNREGTDYPAAIRAAYLQLPDSVPPR